MPALLQRQLGIPGDPAWVCRPGKGCLWSSGHPVAVLVPSIQLHRPLLLLLLPLSGFGWPAPPGTAGPAALTPVWLLALCGGHGTAQQQVSVPPPRLALHLAPLSLPAAGPAYSAAFQQCSFLEGPGMGLAAAWAQLSFLHLLPCLQLSLLFSFTSEPPSLPPAAASGPTAAPPPSAACVEVNSCLTRGSLHFPEHSCPADFPLPCDSPLFVGKAPRQVQCQPRERLTD